MSCGATPAMSSQFGALKAIEAIREEEMHVQALQDRFA
jgi:hypothetical protein